MTDQNFPAGGGDPGPWHEYPQLECHKCLRTGAVRARTVTWSCGGYNDSQYHCQACDAIWWIEGDDGNFDLNALIYDVCATLENEGYVATAKELEGAIEQLWAENAALKSTDRALKKRVAQLGDQKRKAEAELEAEIEQLRAKIAERNEHLARVMTDWGDERKQLRAERDDARAIAEYQRDADSVPYEKTDKFSWEQGE